MKVISEQFYRWVWLAPALLPLTQIGGRALFTLIAFIYFLWGSAVFIYEKASLEKKYLLLFFILIISYALSIPFAEDPTRAFRKWFNFTAMASVFPITWMVLQREGVEAAQRLVKWVALLGIAMITVAYGQLFYLLQKPDFSPTQQMKEDSMPYLLPFILLLFYRIKDIKTRWLGIIAATSAILFYAFLSEGRAAQLSAAFAIFLFFITALGIRWYIACLISIACLLAIVLGNLDTFMRLSGNGQGIYDVMNRFSSGRWELWDNAIKHAPDWNLIGYGMGNVRFIDEILTIFSGSRVTHLHNFILDLWFETGWLGLSAFLTFITSIITVATFRFSTMPSERKYMAGAALAAAGAILVAGLFSFSYNSRQFGVYLMLCLAVLVWAAGAKNHNHAEE